LQTASIGINADDDCGSQEYQNSRYVKLITALSIFLHATYLAVSAMTLATAVVPYAHALTFSGEKYW